MIIEEGLLWQVRSIRKPFFVQPFIERRNKQFTANHSNGIKNGSYEFDMIRGSMPVMLSAPHAVRQIRNQAIKKADAFTGPIVEYLCAVSGAHGIVRFCNLGGDPNADKNGHGRLYRDAAADWVLQNKIKIFLDIHAMSDDSVVVEFGTNFGANLNGNVEGYHLLRKIMQTLGPIREDTYFKANQPERVSTYIAKKTGIPCIQMEVSASYRKDPKKRMAFVKAIEGFINSM